MPPSLDNGFDVFTTWQTIALGLTIYVMTAAIRRVVETGKPEIRKNKWWRNVWLPLGPVTNGIFLALFLKSFPWPPAVVQSTSTRIMYALVCGVVCGWLYDRIRTFFRTGVAAGGGGGSNSVFPPPQPAGTLDEPENTLFDETPQQPEQQSGCPDPQCDQAHEEEQSDDPPRKAHKRPSTPPPANPYGHDEQDEQDDGSVEPQHHTRGHAIVSPED